jgi:hypothetical protein
MGRVLVRDMPREKLVNQVEFFSRMLKRASSLRRLHEEILRAAVPEGNRKALGETHLPWLRNKQEVGRGIGLIPVRVLEPNSELEARLSLDLSCWLGAKLG